MKRLMVVCILLAVLTVEEKYPHKKKKEAVEMKN